MRKMLVLASSAAVFFVAASTAHAANQPVPEVRRVIVGTGSRASIGQYEGQLRVHFRNGSGAWKLWDPEAVPAQALEDSIVPLGSNTCSWRGSVLFCSGTNPGTMNDFVFGADMTYRGAPSATYDLPADALYGRGLNNSNGHFAAVEYSDGAIDRFEYIGPYLKPTAVRGPSGLQGFPVVSESYVVYQESPNSLIAWDGIKMVPVLNVPLGWPPKPSQLIDSRVSFETQTSVQSAFIGGPWDPGSMPYDPTDYGCGAFQQMKSRAGIDLVRGVNCQEGSSVLLAMVPGYAGNPKEATFVGKLAAFNPTYEMIDIWVKNPANNQLEPRYYIVFVNDLNQVVFVEVNRDKIVGYEIDQEPNEDRGTAQYLPPWKAAARGVFNSKDDKDFWAIELKDGNYDILTALSGPGITCASNWLGSDITVLTVDFGEGRNKMGPVGTHWMSDFLHENYCGGIRPYEAESSGIYYITVEPDPSYFDWVGPYTYYLTVEKVP